MPLMLVPGRHAHEALAPASEVGRWRCFIFRAGINPWNFRTAVRGRRDMCDSAWLSSLDTRTMVEVHLDAIPSPRGFLLLMGR